MTPEDIPARNPGYKPQRPQIRNMKPPDPSTYERTEPQEEPWEALEPVLTPFQRERTQEVLNQIQDAFNDDDPDLDHLTRITYEALAEAVNTELRDVVTRMQHIIELSLAPASPTQGVTRENSIHLLETLEHATTLLQAQLPREEIATRFLDLEETPFDLAEAIQAHLEHSPLDPAPELWLDPAPIKGDPEHLTEAIHTLTRHLAYRTRNGALGIRVTWNEQHVHGFIGSTDPDLDQTHLITALSQPARLDEDDLDLPLARALLELHNAHLIATTLDNGWTGFQFRLPALERETTP